MNNGMILWILLLIPYTNAEVFPLKYLALFQVAISAQSLSEQDLDKYLQGLSDYTIRSIAMFIAMSYPDFDLALLHCDKNTHLLDANILHPMRALLKHHGASTTHIKIVKTINSFISPNDPTAFIKSFASAELWYPDKTELMSFNLNNKLSQKSPEEVMYELISLQEIEYSYEEPVCIHHKLSIPYSLFDVLDTDFSQVLAWVQRLPNIDDSLNSSIKRLKRYCPRNKKRLTSECWIIM